VTMMEPSVERPVTEVLAGKGQFQDSNVHLKIHHFGQIKSK